MSSPFGKDALGELKQFIDVCLVNPDVLSLPDLNFFKSFIESLGGKVPSPSRMSTEPPSDKPEEVDLEAESDSDLELDTEGCVEPDTLDEKQKMGDPDKEVSLEDEDKSDEKRSEAMSYFVDGSFEKSIELFTEAIELNPSSSLLFAKRSQAYLKITKPNACIKDCSKALELNPDSASAYKFRGRAYQLLGEWEKAAQDLRQACNIDLDEQIDEWLKDVTPKAKKIEQHALKMERKKAKTGEESARQAKTGQKPETEAPASASSMPKPDDFYKLLQDPEIMAAFADPEVSAAFADISSNPANFYKYKSNAKVMAFNKKLYGKLAASGIGPEGFPGFGGMPGAGAAPSPFAPSDDDNLD